MQTKTKSQAGSAELPPIKSGDRIFFKPEWQDKGDDAVEFRAIEDDIIVPTPRAGDIRRVAVKAMRGLPFNPWSYADVKMIERIERP